MIKINTLFLIPAIILSLFFSIYALNAQGLGGLNDTAKGVGYKTGITGKAADLLDTKIGMVIKIVLSLLGVIFFVIVWIGGFDIIGANGNEELFKKGKERILNGAIGMLVILVAYMFTIVILKIIAGDGAFNI